jgi:hypothetical protein
MKSQLAVLLRIKTLKEEEQLRVANRKRAEAIEAERATQEAQAQVDESKATLSQREDRIYDEIIGKIIDLSEIEDTKTKVVSLLKGHEQLVDEKDRRAHVQRRVEDERDAEIMAHRRALKAVDKYTLMTDTEKQEAQARAEAGEEVEIEDLFCKRRGDRP